MKWCNLVAFAIVILHMDVNEAIEITSYARVSKNVVGNVIKQNEANDQTSVTASNATLIDK